MKNYFLGQERIRRGSIITEEEKKLKSLISKAEELISIVFKNSYEKGYEASNDLYKILNKDFSKYLD